MLLFLRVNLSFGQRERFKNEDNLASYTQIFEKFTRKFSFQLTSLSEFLKFLVEWFAFRILNSFRNFWKLFREILFHLPLFLNYWIFESFVWMESVHRISVDGQKGIKIKTMTRNIACVCVCNIAPSRVQLTSRRPIDLFSLYVLVSQYRSCDNTLENSPFKFHVIHVHISMHKLWKDKGSYSPGTSIRKTKYTS